MKITKNIDKTDGSPVFMREKIAKYCICWALLKNDLHWCVLCCIIGCLISVYYIMVVLCVGIFMGHTLYVSCWWRQFNKL